MRRLGLLAGQPLGEVARQFVLLRRLVDRHRQEPVGLDPDLVEEVRAAAANPRREPVSDVRPCSMSCGGVRPSGDAGPI